MDAPDHDFPLAARMQGIEGSGVRRMFDLIRTMEDPINLSIGQADYDAPPAVAFDEDSKPSPWPSEEEGELGQLGDHPRQELGQPVGRLERLVLQLHQVQC